MKRKFKTTKWFFTITTYINLIAHPSLDLLRFKSKINMCTKLSNLCILTTLKIIKEINWKKSQNKKKKTQEHFPKYFQLCFSLSFSHKKMFSFLFSQRKFRFEFSSRVSVLSATRVEHFLYFYIFTAILFLKGKGKISAKWHRHRLLLKSLKGDKKGIKLIIK